jgi:hypothetical protein
MGPPKGMSRRKSVSMALRVYSRQSLTPAAVVGLALAHTCEGFRHLGVLRRIGFAKSASQSITSSQYTSVAIDSMYPSQISIMRQIAFPNLTAVAIPHQ